MPCLNLRWIESGGQSKLRFIVLQAPVSDREHLETVPTTAKYVALAKAMKAAGNSEEMMPRDALFAPITATRFLDLATKVTYLRMMIMIVHTHTP